VIFKKYIFFTLMVLIMFLGYACNKPPKPVPPGTINGNPIPPGTIKGQPIINLTPDLIYPGSTLYEGSIYSYVAPDSPEKVAKWFEDNLKGSTVERRSASIPTDTKWIVTYKDLIIDIVYGPNQTDTLIRYKKDLSKK